MHTYRLYRRYNMYAFSLDTSANKRMETLIYKNAVCS